MAEFVRQWPQKLQCNSNPLRIALSGGSSLAAVHMVQNILPSRNWELYQVDERFVPNDHADSNQKAIRTLMKDTLPPVCHWWDTDVSIDDALAHYAHTLHADGDGDFFDLVILGVGPDGHTASVFPASMDLDTSDLVAHTTTDRFAVKERVTLTLNTLKKSKEIWVVLVGEKKQDVWERLKSNTTDEKYPASLVMTWPNVKVIWV